LFLRAVLGLPWLGFEIAIMEYREILDTVGRLIYYRTGDR
jgi:hypothetical protein